MTRKVIFSDGGIQYVTRTTGGVWALWVGLDNLPALPFEVYGEGTVGRIQDDMVRNIRPDGRRGSNTFPRKVYISERLFQVHIMARIIT